MLARSKYGTLPVHDARTRPYPRLQDGYSAVILRLVSAYLLSFMEGGSTSNHIGKRLTVAACKVHSSFLDGTWAPCQMHTRKEIKVVQVDSIWRERWQLFSDLDWD